jgi:MFS family permease
MNRYRSLVGVIAAMGIVNLVYGITFPLLALVLDSQQVSKTLIGLSTMTQAAAIFFVAPVAPRLLRRWPAGRVMQIAALSLTLLFLLAGAFPNVYFWFPLRFVLGGLNAMLWIASEALINELAPDHRRARVISVYSSVGAAGFALGPLLLILTGSDGMLPFLATSTMILLAIAPLFAVDQPAAGETQGEVAGFWRIFLLAPTVMLANLAYAAAAESMITFFPLFGMHFGLSEQFALGLMTLVGAGSMILILPLGVLADRVDKMGMLSVIVLLSMVGLLLMPEMMQAPYAPLFFFVFGGVEGMIYALGVTLVGEHFKGAMLAGASTVFTTFWGAGTVAGPLLVGAGMDIYGTGSMAFIICLMFAAFLPLPVLAWWRGRPARAAAGGE